MIGECPCLLAATFNELGTEHRRRLRGQRLLEPEQQGEDPARKLLGHLAAALELRVQRLGAGEGVVG